MTKDSWLYDPRFWSQVEWGPFDANEKEIVAALSKEMNVPEDRIRERKRAFFRGYFAEHEMKFPEFVAHYNPGNGTIN